MIGSPRMHIAFLIWSFLPAGEGGAERQCRLVARQLSRMGSRCTVFTAWLDESWPETDTIEGIRVHRVGMGIERILKGEARWRSVLDQLALKMPRLQTAVFPAIEFWLKCPANLAARRRFVDCLVQTASTVTDPVDIVHVFETSWLSGVGDMLAEHLTAVPLCRSASMPAIAPIPYDVPLRREWERRRRRPFYAAMTPAMIADLIANGIPEQRTFLVPNGIEPPTDSAEPAKSDKVLYVGNFTQGGKWKAFDILIRAWARIHRVRPKATLTIVGGGNSKPWKAMADAHECEDSIEWIGPVADPCQHYARAGIFVLPSRVEGMSNALLEAQGWGLPCVVSDIPGNTYIVKHEFNGLVIPKNRSRDLADAILRLLDNPRERDRLGSAARNRTIENFSISSAVDGWMDVYRKIVS